MTRALPLLLLLPLFFAAAQRGGEGAPAAPGGAPLQRGVALGLFASDPEWDYDGMLGELRGHGATDVELVVPWFQAALDASEIASPPGTSPSPGNLRRTIRRAHARGLRVTLFPILRVGSGDDWRGRIAPADRAQADRWWSSYGALLAGLAATAQAEGVARLSVGSELLGLEGERERWRALIAEVRRAYTGRLIYSANWDHYEAVSFWDLVDEIGVTGYFELTGPDPAETWSGRLAQLGAFARRLGRPLVLTEVGYPSQAGAGRRPWDQTGTGPVDLDEQRRCYEAFCRAAAGAPAVRGVYFWNWFGVGGPRDRGYTPRGKPAARVLQRCLRDGGAPALPGSGGADRIAASW